jgi:3-hydroxyisobutyryl-CoA hydrolase
MLVTSEHGLATHYVPARRIPELIERLASLEDASLEAINATIEEHVQEPTDTDAQSTLVGPVRAALDSAFRFNRVESIFKELRRLADAADEQDLVKEWAKKTLDTLEQRSPTSLKIALHALRKGHNMSLRDALDMELGLATAFCVSRLIDYRSSIADAPY